jgi:putative membrane protein
MQRAFIVVFVLTVGAGAALAQSQTTSPYTNKEGTPQTRAATSDPQFAMVAAQAGMGEVELGQLAQQLASNTEVKQFAARMVADHTKSNDELKQAAAAAQVTLPEKTDAAHNALKQQLSQLKGDAFDKAYMDAMVQDHHTAVSLFQGQAKNGSQPALKSFAQKTLPTLQEHLKMAQQIAKAVGSKGGQK